MSDKAVSKIEQPSLLLRCQNIVRFGEVLCYIQIDNGAKRLNQVICQVEVVQLASVMQPDAGLQPMNNQIACDATAQDRVAIVQRGTSWVIITAGKPLAEEPWEVEGSCDRFAVITVVRENLFRQLSQLLPAILAGKAQAA